MRHDATKHIVWLVEDDQLLSVRAVADILGSKFGWPVATLERVVEGQFSRGEDSKPTLDVVSPSLYAQMLREGAPLHKTSLILVQATFSLINADSPNNAHMRSIFKRYANESPIVRPKLALFTTGIEFANPVEARPNAIAPADLFPRLSELIPNLGVAEISSRYVEDISRMLSVETRGNLREKRMPSSDIESLLQRLSTAVSPLISLYVDEAELASSKNKFHMAPKKDGSPISEFERRSAYLDPLIPYYSHQEDITYESGLVNLKLEQTVARLIKDWDKSAPRLILDVIHVLLHTLLLNLDLGTRVSLHYAKKYLKKLLEAVGRRGNKNSAIDKVCDIVASVQADIKQFCLTHGIGDSEDLFIPQSADDKVANEVKFFTGRSSILLELLDKAISEPNTTSIVGWKPRFVVHATNSVSVTQLVKMLKAQYPSIAVFQLGEASDEETCEDFLHLGDHSPRREDESEQYDAYVLVTAPPSYPIFAAIYDKFLKEIQDPAQKVISSPQGSNPNWFHESEEHVCLSSSKTAHPVTILIFGSSNTLETIQSLQQCSEDETVVTLANSEFCLSSIVAGLPSIVETFTMLVTRRIDAVAEARAFLDGVNSKVLKRYQAPPVLAVVPSTDTNGGTGAHGNTFKYTPSLGPEDVSGIGASLPPGADWYAGSTNFQGEQRLTSPELRAKFGESLPPVTIQRPGNRNAKSGAATSPLVPSKQQDPSPIAAFSDWVQDQNPPLSLSSSATPLPNQPSSTAPKSISPPQTATAQAAPTAPPRTRTSYISDIMDDPIAPLAILGGINGNSAARGGIIDSTSPTDGTTLSVKQSDAPSASQSSQTPPHSSIRGSKGSVDLSSYIQVGGAAGLGGKTPIGDPIYYIPSTQQSAMIAPVMSPVALHNVSADTTRLYKQSSFGSELADLLSPSSPIPGMMSSKTRKEAGQADQEQRGQGTNSDVESSAASAFPAAANAPVDSPDGPRSLNSVLDEVMPTQAAPQQDEVSELPSQPQASQQQSFRNTSPLQQESYDAHERRLRDRSPSHDFHNPNLFGAPHSVAYGYATTSSPLLSDNEEYGEDDYYPLPDGSSFSSTLSAAAHPREVPRDPAPSPAMLPSVTASNNAVTAQHLIAATGAGKSETNSDPISLLHIFYSKTGLLDPVYEENVIGGSDHARVYEATCTLPTGENFTGIGTRKKDAKKAAAAYALEFVANIPASNYGSASTLVPGVKEAQNLAPTYHSSTHSSSAFHPPHIPPSTASTSAHHSSQHPAHISSSAESPPPNAVSHGGPQSTSNATNVPNSTGYASLAGDRPMPSEGGERDRGMSSPPLPRATTAAAQGPSSSPSSPSSSSSSSSSVTPSTVQHQSGVSPAPNTYTGYRQPNTPLPSWLGAASFSGAPKSSSPATNGDGFSSANPPTHQYGVYGNYGGNDSNGGNVGSAGNGNLGSNRNNGTNGANGEDQAGNYGYDAPSYGQQQQQQQQRFFFANASPSQARSGMTTSSYGGGGGMNSDAFQAHEVPPMTRAPSGSNINNAMGSKVNESGTTAPPPPSSTPLYQHGAPPSFAPQTFGTAESALPFHPNPIGLVNEYHQKKNLALPNYHDAGRASGSDHEPLFRCICVLSDGSNRRYEATGSSKKDAKTSVALTVARVLGLI